MSEAALDRRTNGRLAAWLALVGTLTALNYLGRFSGDTEPDRDVLYTWSQFAGGLIQFSILLGLVLWIAAGGPARELLALRRPRSWGRAAGIMVAVFLGTLAVSGLLSSFVDPGEEQGLTPEGWDPTRAAPFVANFLIVAAFTPVVEELMFRGLGYSLFTRFGTAAAIVTAGVLFGPAHGLVLGLPILVVFGLGLAWLRSRSDSVFPCIVLHGAFNAFALVAAVTLGG